MVEVELERVRLGAEPKPRNLLDDEIDAAKCVASNLQPPRARACAFPRQRPLPTTAEPNQCARRHGPPATEIPLFLPQHWLH